MRIQPGLQIILDAELLAGNVVDRAEEGSMPWQHAVYLKLPMHDSYFATMIIPGVRRGIPDGSDAMPDLEWYQCKRDAVFAPMPKVYRYSEFYQRAQDEGRALPINQWMKEPKVRRRTCRSMDLYQKAAEYADRIEGEMRKIGMWSERPPAPEAFEFRRAFAGDTMTYSQWLQFILLPRVRQIIANKEKFPGSSSTATQAVREFDGRDDCEALISLLAEFDRHFEARR